MNVTVLQEELIKGLGVISRIVAARGQMPVLANVLIEAENKGIVLAATNLELAMRIDIGGKVNEPGAITVPAKALTEFMGTVPGGAMSLESAEEKLKVATGKFKATFAGIGAGEFPTIAEKVAGKKSFKIKKSFFIEAANKVAFAAATDESRPVLTGVKFQTRNSKLELTATDGFRLSRQTMEMEGEFPSMILPAKAIFELAKIISEGRKEEVEMQVAEDSNQVIFEYDKFQLVSRILEGNFPDVDKIIPTDFKTTAVIERLELLQAVRAAAIFARETNNIIKFEIRNSKIELKAMGGQTGGSEVEVETESSGEDSEISFNFRYVLDFLGSVDFERVVLLTNGPLEKGVWRGEKDETLTHLIMPVRV